MADPEQLALLKQGVKVWNEWRKQNKNVRSRRLEATSSGPDLDDADLHGANLRRANFSDANLRKANLRDATLIDTHLGAADLGGADLSGANLRGANLRATNLYKASLIATDLHGADLMGAHLRAADLTDANLRSANLRYANLRDADLRRADLSEAKLIEGHLRGANFGDADIGQADLRGANLRRANLRGANLRWSSLVCAELVGANLSGADLVRADLSGADLAGAELVGADLSKAILIETVFGGTDLRNVQGLDDCQHRGPSTLDHRTITKSAPLPLPFLRGCGLPDQFIEYLPSLFNQAIQFYSCFISYSTKDQAFAERLHADLQNKAVRCWFAPHDMQSGRKLYDQIDEAIRLYDRLLLILSEHSISSEWVQTEIAKARRRELREARRMLFPVRLIDFETLRDWECFDADTGKDSAREIREYFIPDFSNWKDHDSYQEAFVRLLKDLKSDQKSSGSAASI